MRAYDVSIYIQHYSGVGRMKKKVFVHVVRVGETTAEVLVFDSLEEPGYEVPKGSVEPGESLEEAVHREVYEESGLKGLNTIKELGKTYWGDEDQHFFLVEAPPDVADTFEHEVTGEGIDTGFWYRYLWLEIGRELKDSWCKDTIAL
jgi:8-oxo-dGTP pyrophosphatase MutT (NUDIX family)